MSDSAADPHHPQLTALQSPGLIRRVGRAPYTEPNTDFIKDHILFSTRSFIQQVFMEHQLYAQHCGPGHKTKMGPVLMGSLSRDGYKPAITRSCDRSFKIGVMGVQARNCHPDSGSPGKGSWGVRPEDE